MVTIIDLCKPNRPLPPPKKIEREKEKSSRVVSTCLASRA